MARTTWCASVPVRASRRASRKIALNSFPIYAVCPCSSMCVVYTRMYARRREQNVESAFYTGTHWNTITVIDKNKGLMRI
jgi:hypothetical protein